MHGLPGRLIISLTSYPPRFRYLRPVLKSLLSQSVRPDALILWIAEDDINQLPSSIWALEPHGLSIRTCPDWRSYKKIIPTLLYDPEAFIVTADDDILYERGWLRSLVREYRRPNEIVFRRGHALTMNADGTLRPYREWKWEQAPACTTVYSFPTCGAGALYPPYVFHADVTATDLFQELAATSDDLWLYWMGQRNGAVFRRVGPEDQRVIVVMGAQKDALSHLNNGPEDLNTASIRKLEAAFGIVKAAPKSQNLQY